MYANWRELKQLDKLVLENEGIEKYNREGRLTEHLEALGVDYMKLVLPYAMMQPNNPTLATLLIGLPLYGVGAYMGKIKSETNKARKKTLEIKYKFNDLERRVNQHIVSLFMKTK